MIYRLYSLFFVIEVSQVIEEHGLAEKEEFFIDILGETYNVIKLIRKFESNSLYEPDSIKNEC